MRVNVIWRFNYEPKVRQDEQEDTCQGEVTRTSQYVKMVHVQWSPSLLGKSCPSHLAQEILNESDSIIRWNILAEVIFSKKGSTRPLFTKAEGWDVAHQRVLTHYARGPEINVQHYNKHREKQKELELMSCAWNMDAKRTNPTGIQALTSQMLWGEKWLPEN